LILIKIEGKSIKEVAHILEKTPKAIESLLQRAKHNSKNTETKPKDYDKTIV